MARLLIPCAALLGAVLAGCGPMVIWTGHTPDRRARVQVHEHDGGQSVTVGDSAGPTYDGIAASGLVFSPDGKEYKELAKIKVAETDVYAHPVIAGKRIFVKDKDSLTLWTVD